MIPCLRFTGGVIMTAPPHPAGMFILAMLSNATAAIGHDLMVTCAEDPKGHAPEDPHNKRCAYDIRTYDLSDMKLYTLALYIKDRQGPWFYSQYEFNDASKPKPVLSIPVIYNARATGPHIHIQLAQGQQYPPASD